MKTPIIIPIIEPNINWTQFVSSSEKIIGRSPTRCLDRQNISVGDVRSILGTIGGFLYEDIDVLNFIRTNHSVLKHIHYTFLCKTESEIVTKLRHNSDLNISAIDENVFILSGNLLQFKMAIVEQSNRNTNKDLRFFVNCLYVLFKLRGLEDIWHNYSKSTLEDGTLEIKSVDY